MFVHRNSALSLVKRREMVLFLSGGGTAKAAQSRYGVGANTVRRWRRRWLEEGPAGLEDRSARPRVSPGALPPETVSRIEELRRERRSMRRIASETGAGLTSVSRVLGRAGLSRVRDLDPPEPDNRYEHPAPGDMLHVDVKRLARFDAPGHRATGDRSLGRSQGVGHDYLFVAVDDHSRLALVGVYPDERKDSAADFLDKAMARMAELGAPVRSVLSDNGRSFFSDRAREAYRRHGAVHKRTRPYRPRTNGKAERFVQTLLREWAYAKAYPDSNERNRELGPFLGWYNEHRAHSALGGRPPVSRLPNVLENDT